MHGAENDGDATHSLYSRLRKSTERNIHGLKLALTKNDKKVTASEDCSETDNWDMNWGSFWGGFLFFLCLFPFALYFSTLLMVGGTRAVKRG